MNEHDIAEQAYKNGYAAGVKDFAEILMKNADNVKNFFSWTSAISVNDVNRLLTEMVGD